MSNSFEFPICAKLIYIGRHLSLLVEAPILDGRKACHVQVSVENFTFKGIGVSLDTNTVLLAINAPAFTGLYKVGSTLAISRIRIVGRNVAFERIRERLRSLLNLESLGSVTEREARHALLYILEASDPEIRRQRLEILKGTIG